jgi:hypothetical protein
VRAGQQHRGGLFAVQRATFVGPIHLGISRGREGWSCVVKGEREDRAEPILIEKVCWIVAGRREVKRGALRRVPRVQTFHICCKINL